ncbi:MAG: hypothetical protein IJK51_04445 [Bacteroidaceae bacterium]|nr:hypothetical protein [Bacteroidaceae bacterium]
MKKAYITPQETVVHIQCTKLVAASASDRFNQNLNEQDIFFTDDEFDGEFSVKEFSFDDSF